MPVATIVGSALQARLVLVRHGESVLGRARRYAGHRDTPLTTRGRRQISRLRPRFKDLNPELIFSSDLRRCLETATLLAGDREVRATLQLRELDFGAWEGLTAKACLRRDPERFESWLRDPTILQPPDGESLAHLWKRVRAYISALVYRHPGRTLAIVTHAGPIRALVARDPSQFWSEDVPPGVLLEVVWDADRSAALTPRRRCTGR